MKFALNPEEMARTYTYLATSDEVSHVTGKYFDENNSPVKSSKYSKNANYINEVMDLTFRTYPTP
jgi:hypothetical protein